MQQPTERQQKFINVYEALQPLQAANKENFAGEMPGFHSQVANFIEQLQGYLKVNGNISAFVQPVKETPKKVEKAEEPISAKPAIKEDVKAFVVNQQADKLLANLQMLSDAEVLDSYSHIAIRVVANKLGLQWTATTPKDIGIQGVQQIREAMNSKAGKAAIINNAKAAASKG